MSYINISEVAKQLNITTRSIQRRCAKEGIEKRKGVYLITDKVLKDWLLNGVRRDVTRQKNVVSKKKPVIENDENIISQDFTADQYKQFEFKLKNYPILEKDHAVLKERSEQQQGHIHTLKDNLNLANNRIKLLEKSQQDQLGKLLEGINNTLSVISENNHLKFIEVSEVKPKE